MAVDRTQKFPGLIRRFCRRGRIGQLCGVWQVTQELQRKVHQKIIGGAKGIGWAAAGFGYVALPLNLAHGALYQSVLMVTL